MISKVVDEIIALGYDRQTALEILKLTDYGCQVIKDITRQVRCEYCGCKVEPKLETCNHCGAPL